MNVGLTFNEAGTKTTPIKVDYTNLVSETNENNNTGTASINISSATSTAITVLSPNGGEQWVVGSGQTIKWSGGSGSTDIYLYNNIPDASCGFCNYALVIASNIPVNQGQYTWLIPNNLALGNTFYIRLSGGSTADNSDAPFSIVPTRIVAKELQIANVSSTLSDALAKLQGMLKSLGQ